MSGLQPALCEPDHPGAAVSTYSARMVFNTRVLGIIPLSHACYFIPTSQFELKLKKYILSTLSP